MNIKALDRKYTLYCLVSEAQSLEDLKKNLLIAYSLYVNQNTAKEPVIQMVANAGESLSKKLISLFEKIVNSINNLNIKDVENLIKLVNTIKNDPEKTVRNFIHDSIRVTKESEKNYREHVKSKYEMVLNRIASLLGIKAEAPQRKELSKDRLLEFSRTPAAEKYGLNMDILEKMLVYPEVKAKLTTLINAVYRQQDPKDAAFIMYETKELKDWFDNKKTNQEEFENEGENENV